MADGKVVVDSSFDGSGAEQGFAEFQSKMDGIASKAKKAGKAASTFITAPIAAAGTAAVVFATGFDDSMRKVEATMGAKLGGSVKEVDASIKALRDEAKLLGSTTAFSASEAAGGMEKLALAGWDTNEILAATGPMLSLASAASMDLSLAADIVTDTMSAFGMSSEDATKATDIFAKTSSSSNTDVSMLGEAMKQAGASANAAGMDLEQTSAILGKLADAGIKGGAAGTTLSAMLRDVKGKAEDGAVAIGKTKVAVYDANGDMRDMTSILADVEGATEGMTGAQRDAALTNIFGDEAMRGVNVSMQAGTDSIRELENELYNANGTSKAMAEHMEGGLGGAFRGLKSSAEGLAISFGEDLAPYIQIVADKISEINRKFTDLSPKMRMIIIVVAGILAAIGPLLIIFGTLVSSISKLMPLFNLLKLAMLGISWPVVLIIAAFAALIAIGYLVWKNWDTIKAKAIEIWGAISEWFSVVWQSIKETFTSALNATKEFLSKTWDSIKATVINVFESIKMFFISMWNGIVNLAIKAFENMKNNIDRIITLVSGIISSVWDFIKDTFRNALTFIKQLVTGDFSGMRQTIDNQMEKAKTLLSGIWDSINTFMSSILGNIWKTVKQKFSDIVNSVKEKMGSIKSTIKGIWDDVLSFFKGISLYSLGRDIVGGLWRGIKGMAGTLKRNVKSFISNNIPGPIKKLLRINSPSKVTEEIGEDTGEGVVVGLGNKVRAVEGKAGMLAQASIPASVGNYQPSNNGGNNNGSDMNGMFEALKDLFSKMNIEIPVLIDGRVVAKTTAPLMNRELQKLRDLTKRPKG